MDTISRSEVRNYATAAGFLVLAMILLECFVCQIVPSLSLQQAGPVTFFGALILMLAGVILAVEK